MLSECESESENVNRSCGSPKWVMYGRQKQVSEIAMKNHASIEEDEGTTAACKLLQHHFEVLSNGGYWKGKYEGDKYELLMNLSGLKMTEDERLCTMMLKEPSKEKMLEQVNVWSAQQRSEECTHEEMVEQGDDWSKDTMLGQLWELYRGFITG